MPGTTCITRLRVTSDDKSVKCSGIYLLEAQQRFGGPCYTRMGRAGAIYYDGSYWKICQVGNGKTADGWNFSQRAPADAVPVGQWNRELRMTNEADRDYSTLTVTVEGEAASSAESTAEPAFGAPVPAFGAAVTNDNDADQLVAKLQGTWIVRDDESRGLQGLEVTVRDKDVQWNKPDYKDEKLLCSGNEVRFNDNILVKASLNGIEWETSRRATPERCTWRRKEPVPEAEDLSEATDTVRELAYTEVVDLVIRHCRDKLFDGEQYKAPR